MTILASEITLTGLIAQERRNPQFTLSLLAPCGQTLEAPAGSAYDDGTGGGDLFANGRPGDTWDVVLTTADNPGSLGTKLWSFGLGSAGALSITDITFAGTVSCHFTNGPPCLMRSGGSLVEITGPPDGKGPQTEENRGAGSVVVLAFGIPVFLPREGPSVVAKIRVYGEFPSTEGETVTSKVYFASRRGSEPFTPFVWTPVGSVQAVTPTEGNPPLRLEDCEVTFKALAPITAAFVRCDPNDDGKANIADAVWIFREAFLSGPATRCPAGSDCDANGKREITDGIYALSYQLTGGLPPPAPFPRCGRAGGVGPEDCPLGSTRCP